MMMLGTPTGGSVPGTTASAGPVFGVALEELARRTGEPHTTTTVPALLKPMLHYLAERGTTEPLFRQAASTKELQDLRYHLNKGGKVDYEAKPKTDLVASLFKIFLRELPEPLLTSALYPQFLAVSEVNDEKKRIAVLSELLEQLPKANRCLVELILRFFSRLCKQADVNQLGPAHLAHIFTPVFMRPKCETIETMIQLPKAMLVTQLLMETEPDQLFSMTPARGTSPINESSVIDSSLPSSASKSDATAADSETFLTSPRRELSPATSTSESAASTGAEVVRSPRSPPQPISPRLNLDSTANSPEIDSKVAHLKATVQEALHSLRKDLDELEEELVHASSAERVIEIARAVRATKKALDARGSDA